LIVSYLLPLPVVNLGSRAGRAGQIRGLQGGLIEPIDRFGSGPSLSLLPIPRRRCAGNGPVIVRAISLPEAPHVAQGKIVTSKPQHPGRPGQACDRRGAPGSHVTNILNRLGFTARAQVAVWAADRDLLSGTMKDEQ
jgi:hypothetical protein